MMRAGIGARIAALFQGRVIRAVHTEVWPVRSLQDGVATGNDGFSGQARLAQSEMLVV